MKKFLKVFIIILSVLTVIGGTSYFFFKDLRGRNNNTGSISAMLESESKLMFDNALNRTFANVNSDGADDRLSLIIETGENLDEIVSIFASYYVKDNTAINDEKIFNQLQRVKASRTLLNRMMTEYNLKAGYNFSNDLKFFDMHQGANDLYKQSCKYLVEYATFANLLNASLTKVDKSSDFKFSMFEIYSNIVIDQFSSVKETSKRVEVENDENIKFINNIFVIDDSYIKTSVDKFSITINKFNEVYNKCNKKLFASELNKNIEKVSSESEASNEKVATYYFKIIYGI